MLSASMDAPLKSWQVLKDFFVQHLETNMVGLKK